MTQKFEELVQKISSSSKLLRVWQLAGGISVQMTALEIERADGSHQKMIVRCPGAIALRQNPHAARDEFNLLQILHSAGLLVPAPIYLNDSRELLPASYLVIEYVQGETEFAPADTKGFTFQYASQLAQIHKLNPAQLNLSFLPRLEKGCAENLERDIQSNMSFELERVRTILQAMSPFKQRNASVLLHGDFWGGNILWRDGKLVAVIDWENAELGDPLSDFAISRLDTLWIYGRDAFDSFTEYYQSLMRLDYTDLPYWDLCAAFRLLRMIGANLSEWVSFFYPYGRTDITEQTFRDHYQFFIQQAFEKLAVI